MTSIDNCIKEMPAVLFDEGISANGRSMGEQLMNQKMIQKNRREPLLIPGDFRVSVARAFQIAQLSRLEGGIA